MIVLPRKFEFSKSTILAYDGTEASVFAIKQFAYIFPELTDNKTILVYVNEKGKEEFPEQVSIEELTAHHFKDLTLYD